MCILFMACCWPGPSGNKDAALTTPKVKKSKSFLDGVSEPSHTKQKKQAPQDEQTPGEKQTHTRLTAAKAKVKPEGVLAIVKNECVAPETARAVAECLKRKSTEELGKATTPEVITAGPGTGAPPVNHPQHPGDEDTSSDEDPEEHERQREEFARRERQMSLKRQAHARYMRFSRSLTSFLATARLVVGWWYMIYRF